MLSGIPTVTGSGIVSASVFEGQTQWRLNILDVACRVLFANQQPVGFAVIDSARGASLWQAPPSSLSNALGVLNALPMPTFREFLPAADERSAVVTMRDAFGGTLTGTFTAPTGSSAFDRALLARLNPRVPAVSAVTLLREIFAAAASEEVGQARRVIILADQFTGRLRCWLVSPSALVGDVLAASVGGSGGWLATVLLEPPA